jgi:hypothetical protein
MKNVTVLALISLSIAALLPGCTIYETCARQYRNDSYLGVSLTEACSRGVTFRKTSVRASAELQCGSNFFNARTKNACYHGIDLRERFAEGQIYKQGLDD